jgi:peptidoglycan/xylan/chitin deacetylase (PgdA/CDA1 family)
MFALTFDDGPGPSTAALLDVLAQFQVRATFFLIGRNLEEAPWGTREEAQALARRELREGHVLGNHTYSHLRPDRWRELKGDLLRGHEAVKRIAGERHIPFRLPYGVRLVEQTVAQPAGTLNAVTIDPRLPVIASLGIGHQHWTADFDDWTVGDAALIARKMIEHVQQLEPLGLDAVMDLHDSGTGSASGYDRSTTVEAVKLFLEAAKARGWRSFAIGDSR